MKNTLKASALFLLSAGLQAQQPALAHGNGTTPPNDRIHDTNRNAWYQYFGDHYFAKRWGLHTEIQARRYNVALSDPWSAKQQLLIRGGINFDLTDRVMLTAGYGYITTGVYGDYPALHEFTEHRLYQQVFLKDKAGFVELQHRFRMEERWVQFPVKPTAENPSPHEDYLYLNRARYQIRVQVPLIGNTIDDREPYLAAYDEIFIGFGKNVGYNIFDQNRAGINLGWRFSKDLKLEAGYMSQLVAHRNLDLLPDGDRGLVVENNNTLTLGLTWNLDLRAKESPSPATQPVQP